MEATALSCRRCGAGLPAEAQYCPACGAEQAAAPEASLSVYGTIGTAALLAVGGALLIGLMIAAWDLAFSGVTAEAAAVLGSIALTVLALGALAADLAFVAYLNRRGESDWILGTQAFIGLAWLFVFIAVVVAVAEN